jgi:hypothetical protein
MRGVKILNSEQLFKTKIVRLILSKKPEDALKALSQYYNVITPELKVGMPKGHRKNVGCYVAKKRTIYVSNLNELHNPYVIIHEFYHHLRTYNMKHRGTEKHAERFAKDYIEAYKIASAQE